MAKLDKDKKKKLDSLLTATGIYQAASKKSSKPEKKETPMLDSARNAAYVEQAKRSTPRKSSSKPTSNASKAKSTSFTPNSFTPDSILESARKAVAENKAKRNGNDNWITPTTGRPDAYNFENELEKRKYDFADATSKAYENAKNQVKNKTITINSPMSEKERKARLKEIDSELKQIGIIRSGFSRGGYIPDSEVKKLNTKEKTLKKEKKTLERVGTFSKAEWTSFELADAEEKYKIAQKNLNAAQANVRTKNGMANYQKTLVAYKEANALYDSLKNKSNLYENISKYGDEVNNDNYDDGNPIADYFRNFSAQAKANYRNADLDRKASDAMAEYLNNPTEANREVAYAYDAFAKSYAKNNEKALDDENVKASWITKTAAGYLPQFFDNAPAQALGYGLGSLVIPKVGGAIGAGLASYGANYDNLRGSAYRTLLSAGVDEEVAREASKDETILNSLVESGETALSIGTLGISTVLKAALKKVGVKSLTKTAVNSVAKEAGKSLPSKGLSFLGGRALDSGTDYSEEFVQQIISKASMKRAVQGKTDGSLLADAWNLFIDVITGKNPELLSESHEAGKEGAKISVMFGGGQYAINTTIAHGFNAKSIKQQNEIADFIIQDDEALSALIDEGKASGEGTVSYDIAEEIEASREKGKVTRGQVKRLIASNEVYIANEEANAPDALEIEQSNHTPLEAAARYVVENRTQASDTMSDNSAVQAAYEAGRKNVPIEKVSFETTEQQEAYVQGRREYIMNMPAENAIQENATVVMPENELSNDERNNNALKSEQPFISDRTYEEVGSRKVTAFQYDNPEVKPFYKEIAQELKTDIANTIKGERVPIMDGDGYVDSYTGVSRITSESIAKIKESMPNSPSYADIDNALDRIITDSGQENTALAKRLELVIDDMLTDGYTTFDGYKVPPNDEYIAVKNKIGGIEAKADTHSASSVVDDLLGDNDTAGSTTGNSSLQTDAQYDRMVASSNGTKGVGNNGIDTSGKTNQDDFRYSKIQAREQEAGVHKGDSANVLREQRGVQNDNRNRTSLETRALEILVKDSKFEKLSKLVGNEISLSARKILLLKYENDSRADDGLYDLIEVATYDMLTNPDNELRALFADNIAEYFGEANTNTDIAGNVVPDEVLRELINSVVRNKNGQLIPLYHATDKAYSELRAGDIGIHFGSKAQATQRATDKGISNPVFIEGYLNITNPLVVDEDFWGWNAPQIAKKLTDMGVLTREEGLSFVNGGISSESNARLVELLKSKGYDGIAYTNEHEAGAGTSYIVFDDSQIIRTENVESVTNKAEPKKAVPKKSNNDIVDTHNKKVTAEIVKKVQENSTDINKVKTIPNVKKAFVSGLKRLGKGLDIDIKVYNGKKLGIEGVDGFYDKTTRTMYLDYNHPVKPIQATVRHEVIHVFRQMTPKGFKAFSDFVVKKYKARHGVEAYNTWIENKKAEYTERGMELTDDGANEELCADIGMDMMQNKPDVKSFIAKNKGFANKLVDAINKIKNVVRKAFGLSENVTLTDAMKQLAEFDSTVSTIDGKVERSHTPYGYDGLPAALSVAELNKAQELFISGIAEHEKAQRAVWNRHGKELKTLEPAKRRQRVAELVSERLGDNDTQNNNNAFSIVVLDNGNTYVKASRKVITGNDKAVWRRQITNFFNELLSNEKSMDITTLEGDVLTISKKETANKARDNYVTENGRRKKLSKTEFKVKLNAVAHMDEIAETSIKDKSGISSDTKNHNFAKDGFSYRTAYFEDFDGQYYKLRISVGHNGSIATVYNIGKIKKDSIPATTKIVAAVGSKPFGMMSVDNNISQDEPIVNTNIRKKPENDTIKFSSTIPKGEAPARDIAVPAEDKSGKKVSRGVRTVLEAAATPDGYVTPIMEDIEAGKYSYDVITDKSAQESAFKRISRQEAGKTERVLDTERYKRVLNDTLERFENNELDGKNDVALLQALYTNAANSYDYMNQVDENGVPLAEKLVVAMVQTASKAGQTLQASRLLKKTSPAGKLYDLEMFVKNMNKEIKAQWGEWVDSANAEIENQWGKYDGGRRDYKVDKEAKKRRRDSRRRGMAYSKKQKDIVLDKKLVQQLLSAKNQQDALAIEEKLIKDIASQIKATVGDKLRALRYTSMLLNPRTHVRNIVGNTAFAGIVETRNVLDATLQAAIISDKSQRTKTIALTPTQRAEQKKLLAYADKVFSEQTRYIRGESGKYDTFNNAIDENRTIFGFKPLEGARKINFNLLEREDVWFIRYHFRNHFANALLAKGITANDIDNGKVSNKIIGEAMRYAAEQAQKATFRDASSFAKALNQLEKTNLATELAVSGIVPFKKTPINILKRGVEYSPLSIIKAGYRAINENVSVGKGTLDSVDAAGILENLAEGLTGTAIFALGAWLLRAGILAIRPGDDEDEENLGEAMGHQSYALEIGDYSFTIDWAAPAVMPLFMGAECAKSLEDDEGINILEILARTSDPVIETSMLSGVLGVLDSIRYSEVGSDVAVDLSTEIMSSYMMQYIPSLFGAVARTFDDIESRTSRPSAAGDEGFLEMMGRKIANKMPILRNVVNSAPYVDIMGKYDKKQSGADYFMSALQNFVLPGYISKVTSSNATNELSNIVVASERTDFIPKYVSKIGEHKLTHNEYFSFHKERGTLYDEGIPYLAEQAWYRELDAVQKAEILAGFKEAADKLTKKFILPSYNLNNKKLESVYENGAHAADIVNVYLVDQYIGLTADANSDGKLERAEVVDAIAGMSVDNDTAWDLYLSKYDSATAAAAEEFGIDAKLYMTAVADMDGIKADYRANGKAISGSRRAKVERYLNSVCASEKEYLYLLGTEYPSVKKQTRYIRYFGQ